MRKSLAARPDRTRFVCASAGNHAQGMAYACRHFGVLGVVFMPVTTPQQKIDKTRQFGGGRVEIRLVGDYFDATLAAAQAFAAETGARFLPPFDDADVIEGQATWRWRSSTSFRPRRTSSSSRSAAAAWPPASSRSRRPRARHRACVSSSRPGAPSLTRALDAGGLSTLPDVDNFVDGAAVARIGDAEFRRPRRLRAGGRGRSLPRTGSAPRCSRCSTSRAWCWSPPARWPSTRCATRPLAGRSVVAIVSGGNFDFERLPDVKERALRWEGRKKYYILRLPQRPGALREFLGRARPGGRHRPVRIPQEIRPQLRLGAARHRDAARGATSRGWRHGWPRPASPGSTSPTTRSSPA